LVYLRDKQYTDQLRQVEAALEISRADANRTDANLRALKTQVERARQLAERQYQSAQELESLEAQLSGAEAGYQQSVARIAEAEANVEEQREAVRRTVVRAPISGYVGLKNAEVGMRADPGTPLYTIGNFDEVRVEVSISDRMVNSIKVGDTALIRLDDESGGTVEATVSRISPFLESGSYSATAEIDVRNTDGLLRPGMFVAVDVLYGETNQATLVPESALYEDPRTGQMGIYVATSLRTETPIEEPETYDPVNPPPLTDPTPMAFTPVDVLARGRGVAGVAGLQLGDWVIVIGQNLIRPVDGQTVARARPVTWERIAALQGMQDEDLLRQFMDKQQRLARETFSSPTSSAAPAAMNESATAPGGATAAD
jgi:RND family efflux transporter MFP subunit